MTIEAINQSPNGAILDNIVLTLNGLPMFFNGAEQTLICDAERSIEHFETFPAATVSMTGGKYTPESRSRMRSEVDFAVFVFMSNYNDESPNAPVSRALADMHSQIAKALLTDQTRGKTALTTEVGEWFTDIKENDGGWTDLMLCMQVSCTVFVSPTDPTIRVD